MEVNPLKSQLRRERREDRARDESRSSGRAEKKNRSLSRPEEHHILGRNVDPNLKMLSCVLCHRRLHIRGQDAGADLQKPSTTLHAFAATAAMLGSLFIEVGETLCRDSELLNDMIAGLDREFPKWRQLPEAEWLLSKTR